MISVALNHLLSACVYIITKFALGTADPFFLVTLRMFVSGLITISLYYFLKKRKFKLSYTDLFFILLLAITNMVGKSVLNFWSIQYISVSKAAFINNLNPFISAFFSYLIFKEEFTRNKLIGLGIGLVGFLYLLMNDPATIQSGALSTSISWLSWPEIAILGSTICNSAGFILIRYLKKYRNIDALLFNSVSMLMGTIICLPIVQVCAHQPYIYDGKLYSFLFFFMLLIFDFIVVLQLKAYNLTKYRVTFMTFTAACSMPILTAILNYFICGKPITPHFLTAYFIVFIGLYVFYKEELKQGYIA